MKSVVPLLRPGVFDVMLELRLHPFKKPAGHEGIYILWGMDAYREVHMAILYLASLSTAEYTEHLFLGPETVKYLLCGYRRNKLIEAPREGRCGDC